MYTLKTLLSSKYDYVNQIRMYFKNSAIFTTTQLYMLSSNLSRNTRQILSLRSQRTNYDSSYIEIDYPQLTSKLATWLHTRSSS